MIFFHWTYLIFYIICKKLANKYVYDVPETYAIGFTGFLYTFTIDIVLQFLFQVKLNGTVFIIILIALIVWQEIFYAHKKNYIRLYEKYKNKPLIILPIIAIWIYWLYNYYMYEYHNF